MNVSTSKLMAAGGISLLLLAAVLVLRNGRGRGADEANPAAGSAPQRHGTAKLKFREKRKASTRQPSLRHDDPEVQRQAEAWYQELLALHPEFQVELKNVPDDENGFLKFLDFQDFLSPGEPNQATLPMPDALREMLAGRAEFEAKILDGWIAANPALFTRILEIAEAPDQSVKGQPMQRYQFIGARVARGMNQLLVASARAAMERGEPDEALRHYRASVNLANHFDGVEIPTLLGKTASALLRLDSLDGFQQHLLPRVVDDPDALATWREALPRPESIHETAPPLLVGEWHVSTRIFLLPTLISRDPEWTGEVPIIEPSEQRAVVEAHTTQMAALVERSGSDPFGRLIGDPNLRTFHPDASLGTGANKLIETFTIGVSAWFKGLGRQISIAAQHDALLAIALGEEVPLEPVTGKPFVWDPTSRTLSPPAGAPDDIEPLLLPPAP